MNRRSKHSSTKNILTKSNGAIRQTRRETFSSEISKTTTSPKAAIIISWLTTLLMAGIIFWMSANTGSTINQGLGIISALKVFFASIAYSLFGHEVDVSPVGHFIEYFIFGILLLNALRFHMPLPRAFLIALLLGSIYGITDELHQYFVPERSCDPLDWLVDTIAVTLGALLCRLLIKRDSSESK